MGYLEKVNSMAKKKKATLKDIAALMDTIDFQPTADMQNMKQKVLARMEDNPSHSLISITPELALELTKDKRIKEWLKIPGFGDWLCNKSEFKEKLTSLIDMAMEKAREILSTNNERAYGAQVSLVKIMLEAGNKFPKQIKDSKEKDGMIAAMDEKQLEDFLRKAGYVKLNAANIDKALPITIDMNYEELEE